MRETEVYKLNSIERKKTKHKLKRMNLKKEIEKLTKSLEEKNEEILSHIHNFHTTLKVKKKKEIKKKKNSVNVSYIESRTLYQKNQLMVSETIKKN